MSGEAEEDGPVLRLLLPTGDPVGVSASWLWPGPALATIWGVNQLMEDLSNSAFQIIKKIK